MVSARSFLLLAFAFSKGKATLLILTIADTPISYAASAPSPTSPTMAITGTFFLLARAATPITTFPLRLCSSILPSPVKIKSASFIMLSKPTKSRTVSIPGLRLPLRKASIPAHIAPAAPLPGISETSTPS